MPMNSIIAAAIVIWLFVWARGVVFNQDNPRTGFPVFFGFFIFSIFIWIAWVNAPADVPSSTNGLKHFYFAAGVVTLLSSIVLGIVKLPSIRVLFYCFSIATMSAALLASLILPHF